MILRTTTSGVYVYFAKFINHGSPSIINVAFEYRMILVLTEFVNNIKITYLRNYKLLVDLRNTVCITEFLCSF